MKSKSVYSYFAGFLSALILIAFGASALAAYQQEAVLNYADIQITLNGQPIVPTDAAGEPVEPFAINGTTYLPVRAVATALGLDVAWVQETSTVSLSLPESQRPIFITKSGKKYHYDEHCNGGSYWEVPLATAIGFGLEPCDKCVLKSN